MTIHFITGNNKKYEEAKEMIPEIVQLDIDLQEIQEIDAHEIIKEKLNEARKQIEEEIIVEDTSLYIKGLNGLPGPLIKWFMKTLGNKGIAELTEKTGNNECEAKTIIGYSKKGEIKYFEGTTKGKIVQPRGPNDFGWDQIFQPEGYEKTYAELKTEEKNKISMRKKAFEKLKEYIQNVQ